ncbi:MAG: oxyR [Gemmatimonadetes bacterium]|nr:oxyR [Gemmatimonadota bacterium]
MWWAERDALPMATMVEGGVIYFQSILSIKLIDRLNDPMSSAIDLASTITLTQLAYVAALDTHRHFERAAAACNVTQPTLSMQIRKLETALGAELFDRSRSPVIPTDVGIAVIAQARVVLNEAGRLSQLGGAASGAIAGELRLSVIPTLAPYLLPRVLETIADRHPLLELVVEERVTESALDGLRDDTIDAGLVATDLDAPDIAQQQLFREPFVGYVSKGHRLAGRDRLLARDLSLADLWLLSEGHCMRAQVVTLCQQRRRKSGVADAGAPACTRAARFESGNLETLKRLVERGNGMTLLPALAVADLATAAQRKLVIPFADPVPSRTVSVARRRTHFRQPLVAAVLSIVMEVATAVLGAV